MALLLFNLTNEQVGLQPFATRIRMDIWSVLKPNYYVYYLICHAMSVTTHFCFFIYFNIIYETRLKSIIQISICLNNNITYNDKQDKCVRMKKIHLNIKWTTILQFRRQTEEFNSCFFIAYHAINFGIFTLNFHLSSLLNFQLNIVRKRRWTLQNGSVEVLHQPCQWILWIEEMKADISIAPI